MYRTLRSVFIACAVMLVAACGNPSLEGDVYHLGRDSKPIPNAGGTVILIPGGLAGYKALLAKVIAPALQASELTAAYAKACDILPARTKELADSAMQAATQAGKKMTGIQNAFVEKADVKYDEGYGSPHWYLTGYESGDKGATDADAIGRGWCESKENSATLHLGFNELQRKISRKEVAAAREAIEAFVIDCRIVFPGLIKNVVVARGAERLQDEVKRLCTGERLPEGLAMIESTLDTGTTLVPSQSKTWVWDSAAKDGLQFRKALRKARELASAGLTAELLGAGYLKAQIGMDGRYRFEGVPKGDYMALAVSSAANDPVWATPISIAADTKFDLGDAHRPGLKLSDLTHYNIGDVCADCAAGTPEFLTPEQIAERVKRDATGS